jgi:osmoprotectant transport system substrate-binding protein
MRDNVTRREVLQGAAVGCAVGVAGCASTAQDAAGGGTEVTVGGKQFTEQLLLSNISALMLEDAGVSVDDAFPVGGNTANHEAITGGDTDHYWEYTGTGWNFHLGNEDEKIRDPNELYDAVDEAYQEQHGIEWLEMADFNNTYVVTANPDWQAETGVENLSQLAEHINGGGEVTWAVSQEYLDNPTAFGDLPKFYGFEDNMGNVQYEKMAIGTINYRATAEGQVDLGVGFATNPNLQEFDLGVVEDDQNWFIIYFPAPIVNQDVLTDTVREALNAPVSGLDTETMIELNARVSIDEESPEAVAQDWLESEGLL